MVSIANISKIQEPSIHFLFSYGKFSFSINLEIQVQYQCEKGVSDKWKNELDNERGPGIGQVISEIMMKQDEQMKQDECRIKCEKDGAHAFNWKVDRPQGCRCYGKLATESIKIDKTFNWSYCKKSGKVIGIGYGYT